MAIKHTFMVDGVEQTREITALQAIKFYCRDCSGGSYSEMSNCAIDNCPLHPYRFGKTQNKRKLTDKQREALSKRAVNMGLRRK